MSSGKMNGAAYLEAEFGRVRLECEGSEDFDVVAGFRSAMRTSDERDEGCQEAERDERCLEALGAITYEAVSDARIALGTETVAETWNTPISGVEVLSATELSRRHSPSRIQRFGSFLTSVGNGSINYRVAQSKDYPAIPWRMPF